MHVTKQSLQIHCAHQLIRKAILFSVLNDVITRRLFQQKSRHFDFLYLLEATESIENDITPSVPSSASVADSVTMVVPIKTFSARFGFRSKVDQTGSNSFRPVT